MKHLQQLILATLLVLTSTTGIAQDQNPPSEAFSQAELDQILAPIALYPDTVLSHILVAATYPLEVIQAERWTAANPDKQGSDAVEAVSDEDWDPSVKALVAFPQILKRLSDDLDWTQKLGDAFLQDEQLLLASVQSLRQRAYETGTLDDMEKVNVTREDDSIVIESIEREVVYVPYYDTRVVYGDWHWAHYPPVYWDYPYYDHYAVRSYRPVFWGPRVHVSSGFFFSSLHWRNHCVVRIPARYYRPHQYYNNQQIVRHNQSRRWAHNPNHRRGVAYRSVSVSDRYLRHNDSVRPSRAEVSAHRNAVQTVGRQTPLNGRIEKPLNRNANADVGKSTKPRIADPGRFREELRDENIRQRFNRPDQANRATNAARNKPTTQSGSAAVSRRDNNSRTSSVSSTNVSPRPAARSNTPVRTAPVASQQQAKPPVQYSPPPKQASSMPPANQTKPAETRQAAKPPGVRSNSRQSVQRRDDRRPR